MENNIININDAKNSIRDGFLANVNQLANYSSEFGKYTGPYVESLLEIVIMAYRLGLPKEKLDKIISFFPSSSEEVDNKISAVDIAKANKKLSEIIEDFEARKTTRIGNVA